jgi:hypothetical protein
VGEDPRGHLVTELAIHHDGAALALPAPAERPGTDIVADLGRWLQGAHLAQQIAEVACRGPFVPRAFQGKPEHAATAILAGAELGLSPGMALRSFHVIEGTASLSAKTMRALITAAGHELQLGEHTAETCTLRGRRRGEQEWTEITWTIQEAETAKLLGKDVWQKYPKAMLLARCTTVLGDLKFGDVLAGMPCAEVLEDLGPIIAEADDLPAAPTRTSAAAILARAEQAASAPTQPMAEAAAPAVPPPAEPEVQRYVLPVSKGQLDLIKAAFEKHGFGGRATAVREQRMHVLSALLDREITDPRQLTGDEARIVIDHLGPASGAQVILDILYPGQPDAAAVDEDDYAAAVQEHEDDAARAEAAAEQ